MALCQGTTLVVPKRILIPTGGGRIRLPGGGACCSRQKQRSDLSQRGLTTDASAALGMTIRWIGAFRINGILQFDGISKITVEETLLCKSRKLEFSVVV
jgi:hypothetical protein